MEFNKVKRYTFAAMGGARLLDTTYASGDWAGKKAAVPNADRLAEAFDNVGYVPGNIAYVNATGGNDSTAVLGNQLKPYATIGAAITAIGVLSNSAIYVAAGSYTLTDGDAPYGLKSPGSSYDLYFSVGATIDYYGTYGLYISDQNTTGSIYGFGLLRNYSSTATAVVDGSSGYTINISSVTGAGKYLRAQNLYNYGSCYFMRISDLANKNALVNIDLNHGSVWSFAGKRALTIDGGILFSYNTTYAVTSGSESTVKINSLSTGGPVTTFQDCLIYNWGWGLGSSSDLNLEITNNNNCRLLFSRCEIMTLKTQATSKVVRIYNNAGVYDNTTFEYCKIKSANGTAWLPTDGNSFYCSNAISIKGFDTYVTQINGGAALTNLVGTGNGFMVEPNLY